MSWVILTVIGAIVVLVPTCLVAAFLFSRECRDYVRHYDDRGFSVEECNDEKGKVRNPDGIMVGQEKDR